MIAVKLWQLFVNVIKSLVDLFKESKTVLNNKRVDEQNRQTIETTTNVNKTVVKEQRDITRAMKDASDATSSESNRAFLKRLEDETA